MYCQSQFKHTILWNGIIEHVKRNIETKKRRCGIKYFENCFTGTEFVDLLFEYLLTKQHEFEREVTKEKVIKLSQSIMDSGVFESVNQIGLKFEYTSARLYRFKQINNGGSSCDKNNKENSENDLMIQAKKVCQKPLTKQRRKSVVDSSSISLKKMLDNLREKPKLTENDRHNLSRERITREVILEKLLTLIDLPVVEYFLATNESDIKEERKNLNDPSLIILNQMFDVTRADINEEWRSSAYECIDNLNSPHICIKNVKFLSDMDLYELIREYYAKKSFFNGVFTPLFTSILLLIRHGYYNKALDTLNLGTLLLARCVQAELKRLLKFLYLTSNNTAAPRLSDKKPNNSIVLNHFADCLFKQIDIFSFEETRLILNFMFNNFDYLFTITKELHNIILKRHNYVQIHGNEQTISDKQYCKRITLKEYEQDGKECTAKSLVDLANYVIDDATISLKEKKVKLKQFQEMHPDIYDKHFSNLF